MDPNAPAFEQVFYLGYDKSRFEVCKSKLQFLGRRLGSGAYGAVVSAILLPKEGEDPIEVAVKHPLNYSDRGQYESLIAELKIMSNAESHDNIIRFHGAVTQNLFKGELYVIMEKCECSLYDYLRQDEDNLHLIREQPFPPTRDSLLDICYGIARGMEYLSSRGIIHRDLAARNNLLDGALDPKFADYGLARELIAGYYKVNNSKDIPLPLAWMAPELLNLQTSQKISVMSDVWSYGIVLWEIFTRCKQQPYSPLLDSDYTACRERLQRYLIVHGNRLGPPAACPVECPDEVYQLMRDCWNESPRQRPTFSECAGRLKEMP